MRKDECKAAIRHLCHEWAKIDGNVVPDRDPSFYGFYAWLEANYPQVLRFRSRTSVSFDVELWFDREFKLTWKR